MKKPSERYQELLDSGAIVSNDEQIHTVKHLDQVYDALSKKENKCLSFFGLSQTEKAKGIYLWGEVGAGKSFLLELLLESLNVPKLRQHYHVFMQEIHQQLFALQGTKNPLKQIAKNYAKSYRIFFLDEFIVNDITNAMVLAGLLEALFKENICLVTTSNIHPDDLYEYGFQREKFMPAIEHIKNNTDVIALSSGLDYRKASKNQHANYIYPLTGDSQARLKTQFNELISGKQHSHEAWLICKREIPIIVSCDRVAWFDFHVLCSPPRSQLDYIAISKKIDRLFLSGVPIFAKKDSNQVSLFIKLIDVLYDEGIKLTLSAAACAEEIYPEGDGLLPNLTFSFERTRSRITEMCS